MNYRRFLCLGVLCMLPLGLSGCFFFGLAGALGQNFEYQKLIEVPAKYDGLRNMRVAVLVGADLSLLYEHPLLIQTVATNISQAIAQHVEGAVVISPTAIQGWQYRTPQWSALPYGEIAKALNVDRLVFIDIYEYRLNPPGNSYLWDGAAAADIGITEADSFDPDAYVETFQIAASFPDIRALGRESASATQIETGLLTRFMRQIAYLFYLHEEPKYPDKYMPEVAQAIPGDRVTIAGLSRVDERGS